MNDDRYTGQHRSNDKRKSWSLRHPLAAAFLIVSPTILGVAFLVFASVTGLFESGGECACWVQP